MHIHLFHDYDEATVDRAKLSVRSPFYRSPVLEVRSAQSVLLQLRCPNSLLAIFLVSAGASASQNGKVKVVHNEGERRCCAADCCNSCKQFVNSDACRFFCVHIRRWGPPSVLSPSFHFFKGVCYTLMHKSIYSTESTAQSGVESTEVHHWLATACF